MNFSSKTMNHLNDDFPEYEKMFTSSLTNLPQFHYKEVVTQSYASHRMELKSLFDLNSVLPPRFQSLVTKFPQLGNFLKLKFNGQHRASVIHLIWIRLLEKSVKKDDYEFWFKINDKPIRTSVEEFSLVSGLTFGEFSKNEFEKLKNKESNLLRKYFPDAIGGEKISVKTLFSTITSEMEKSKYENVFHDDLLKLIYVFIAGAVCLPKTSQIIDSWIFKVCDDLDYCESFPWGNYVWELTCKKLFSKTLKSFSKFSNGIKKYEQEGCPLIMLICFIQSITELGAISEISVKDKCAYPRMLRYEVMPGATARSIKNLDENIDKLMTVIPRQKPDETEVKSGYYIKTHNWFSSVIHETQSLSYKQLNEIFSNYVILHDDVSRIESGQPRRPPLVVEPQPMIEDKDGEGEKNNDEDGNERRGKSRHDRPGATTFQPCLMDIYCMMQKMDEKQNKILKKQNEILNKLDKQNKSKGENDEEDEDNENDEENDEEDEEKKNEEKENDEEENEDTNENFKSDHEVDNVIPIAEEKRLSCQNDQAIHEEDDEISKQVKSKRQRKQNLKLKTPYTEEKARGQRKRKHLF